MAECAPSGELYATSPQVARLEDLVTQQQIQIQHLEQERALFSHGFQNFLDEQVAKAQGMQGTSGNDITIIMKFVTVQVAAAVAKLQESNMLLLTSSIPLTKLQQLERRLLERPGSNQDVKELTQRLSILESTMRNTQQKQQQGQQEQLPQQATANIAPEELLELKNRIDCLERNLSNEVQRAYTLASNPGDYGTPLGKLQTQVDILTQDVRRLISLDSRQFIESQIKSAKQSLNTKFSEELAQCATLQTQQRLEQDTRKVEQCVRDIQLSFITSRKTQVDFQDTVAHQFSEERWKALETGLNRRVSEMMKTQSDTFTALIKDQQLAIQSVVEESQKTVNTLDRQLRLLYGPETLERHVSSLQKTLQEEQQLFFNELTTATSTKLKEVDAVLQGHRQAYLEFVSDVKNQLQASELAKRYAGFEQTIIHYEERFAGLQKQYTDIGAKLKEQVARSETLQSNVADQLLGLDQSLASMRASIGQELINTRQSLDIWCAQRRDVLEQAYTSASKAASHIEDKLLQAQTNLQITLDSRRAFEDQWKQTSAEFQKTIHDKFELWTEEQSQYVIRRIAELSGDSTRMSLQVKEQIQRVEYLMSEDVIKEFVSTVEKRMKQVQDEWGQRRVQEFSNRFGEFERQHHALQTAVKEEQQRHVDWVDTIDKSLTKKQTETLGRIQTETRSQTATILRACEEQVASAMTELSSLTETVGDLAQKYTIQTNEAITAEKYQAYQTTIQTQLAGWFSDKNTQIFTKIYELGKEVRATLATAQEQQETLTTLFNDTSLQNHIRQVETRVKQTNEEWRTTQLRNFNGTFAEFTMKFKLLTDVIATVQEDTLDKYGKMIEMRITDANVDWRVEQIRNINSTLIEYIQRYKADINITIQEQNNTIKDYNTQIEERIKKANDIWQGEYIQTINGTLTDYIHKSKADIDLAIQVQNNTIKNQNKQLEERIKKANDIWRIEHQETINGTLTDYIRKSKADIDLTIHALNDKIANQCKQLEARLIEKQQRINENSTPALISKGSHIKNSSTESHLQLKPTWYSGLTKCFYTAIIVAPGQKCDTLGSITPIPGWDYICFTNQETLSPNTVQGWKIIRVKYDGMKPALESKHYKWMSHTWLSDYDVTVWLDGYITPNAQKAATLEHWITKMKENNTMILHRPHAERDCIWDECEAVVRYQRDTSENVERVRRALAASAMPRHWGLFDTNIIIKFQKNLELQDICSNIYTLLQTESVRDQLAVTRVYYTRGFSAYGAKELLTAFIKSGNHVRISV